MLQTPERPQPLAPPATCCGICGVLATVVTKLHLWMPGMTRRGGGAKDDSAEKDVEAAHKGQRFYWVAYKEAFPSTPPHSANTAMFAEYAQLVGRITRHMGAVVGAPMTF